MDKSKDIEDAIRLYKQEEIWKHMTKKELVDYLIPCISLNQYHIFRYETTGVAWGFTNWAFVNDKVQEKFKKTGRLGSFDWNSGKNVWHIDTINNHKGWINKIYSWTAKHFPTFLNENDYVNWIRVTKDGSKIKRINRIKVKDGVKKFFNE